jgi:hypothetical protein
MDGRAVDRPKEERLGDDESVLRVKKERKEHFAVVACEQKLQEVPHAGGRLEDWARSEIFGKPACDELSCNRERFVRFRAGLVWLKEQRNKRALVQAFGCPGSHEPGEERTGWQVIKLHSGLLWWTRSARHS